MEVDWEDRFDCIIKCDMNMEVAWEDRFDYH